MSLLARPFNLIYKYLTAFVIVASPLFFIPGTPFTPEATYYLVIITAITLALISYVLSSIFSGSWHKVTRFEIGAYALLAIAFLLSALLARDPKAILFGNDVNSFSAVSLLSLPAIVYLVRSLPDAFRKNLKHILVTVLGVAALLFLSVFIYSGTFTTYLSQVFGGLTSTLSLAVYVSLFAIISLAFAIKSQMKSHYKAAIFIAAATIITLVMGIVAQSGDIRPNLKSSFVVAKETLLHHGVFGIGSGDFTRAWQLYRPQTVVESPFFDLEFFQGSGTIPTFFTTIGIFGALVFIAFILGALYLTYLSYRKEENETEKRITGLLLVAQTYLIVMAFVVPVSYSIMILWMVIIGLGLGKATITEFHPSKAMFYVMAPVAILLSVHMFLTADKTSALLTYADLTKMSNAGTKEVEAKIDEAIAKHPLDLFYRAKLENAINEARNVAASTTEANQAEMRTAYEAAAEKAVSAGLAAVKVNLYNYQNYVSLGRAYELSLPFDKEGAFDRAKKSYEEAIKLYPENPYLYIIMARLEAAGGTAQGIRTHLTEALKMKQNFADALYLMSQLSASEEKIDEAINYAVSAIQSAPNDPAVYVQAGLLFYGQKNYQDAVTALQRALELDPNNGNIAYFLAVSLKEGGRSDLAKEIGLELKKSNPDDVNLDAFLKSLEPAPATSSKK